ncbi:MAG: hypothetical protein IJ506_08345 [Clostridia bacterium]|nr:hypothetical protein [Clostridia bacterium]
MKNFAINEFRFAVKEYLNSVRILELRSYGRFIGVQNPTEKKKGELLDDILSILIGEAYPVEPSKRGAPVKNDFVDPNIIDKIEELKKTYLPDGIREEESFFTFEPKEKSMLVVNDPNGTSLENLKNKEIYSGQIATVDGVSRLVPLNGELDYRKIVVSVELIRKNDLREGDIVTCYADSRPPCLYATEILSRNGYASDSRPRKKFDETAVAYPSDKLRFILETDDSIASKYFEWLLPIGKGRRGLLLSPPKAGKTFLLKRLVESAQTANPNLTVYALLLDQAPETVGEFRKILPADHILYTTYEDLAEKHIFTADFLLNRAKRQAEDEKDVLIVVDSLTALMRAYNETDLSSGGKTYACGLESKTLHYIKKYLGSARNFEKGGSLTILGAVSVQTGNPADDFAAAELLSVANLRISLSGELAAKRIFPSFDFLSSNTEQPERLLSDAERECEYLLRNGYFQKKSFVDFLLLLKACQNAEELREKMKKEL